MLTTQRVARAVKKAFDPPGVMIAQLNGRGAGQSVFHIHFHVVPRYEGIDLRFHSQGHGRPAAAGAAGGKDPGRARLSGDHHERVRGRPA